MFAKLIDRFFYDASAYEDAALERLADDFEWIDAPDDAAEVQVFRQRIAKWRAYAEGLADHRWRSAFLLWLKYYERELNDTAKAWDLMASNPPH